MKKATTNVVVSDVLLMFNIQEIKITKIRSPKLYIFSMTSDSRFVK